MKKVAFTAMVTLVLCGFIQCSTSNREEIKVSPLAPLPIGSSNGVKGISAPFVTTYNNEIWVAGGCNFPHQPAAEGGSKVYYNEIYRYSDMAQKWELKGHLPISLAYGASVCYNGHWICVGGNNEQSSSTTVLSIAIDKEPLQIDTLPSLPITMDNTAAVRSKNYLYVGGGVCNGTPGTSFYRLNLEEPHEWEELAHYPPPARVQLQLACGMNDEILLLGGFNGGTASHRPEIPEAVWSYSPQTNRWTEVAQLPLCQEDGTRLALVGGFATPLNDSLLLVGGGVNRTRFYEALLTAQRMLLAKEKNNLSSIDSLAQWQRNYLLQPIEWYKFNREIFVFNTRRNVWSNSFYVPEAARAGAGVGVIAQSLYVVGGELKPGIRTDEANNITLPIPAK